MNISGLLFCFFFELAFAETDSLTGHGGVMLPIDQDHYHKIFESRSMINTPTIKRRASSFLYPNWPNGVVHYLMSLPTDFSSERRKTITDRIRVVMDDIEYLTNNCITFVEKNTTLGTLSITSGNSGGCMSYVGYRLHGSKLNLQWEGCLGFGVITHELFHVLGFYHEHQRPDRNSYIAIDDKQMSERDWQNFKMLNVHLWEDLNSPHDYDSITYYRSSGRYKTVKDTGRYYPGQRTHISHEDLDQLLKKYECSSSPKYDIQTHRSCRLGTAYSSYKKIDLYPIKKNYATVGWYKFHNIRPCLEACDEINCVAAQQGRFWYNWKFCWIFTRCDKIKDDYMYNLYIRNPHNIVAPTPKPTPCVELKEWTQSRADSTCWGLYGHEYGVQVCKEFLNENWSRRLEIALANELYFHCKHPCLYDYETYNNSLVYGFKYSKTKGCWNVVDGHWCIDDQRGHMAVAHAKAALLCKLPEEPCEERREWSLETADHWCQDEYSKADKGYGTAVVCDDWERLDDGFYELTSVLYQESFEKSLANHMYRSCTSVCVYDMDHGTEFGYIWKDDRSCWKKVTGYTCYTDYKKELLEVQDRLENDLCHEAPPTPITTPTSCIPRYEWTEERAKVCSSNSYGSTNKSFKGAIVCSDPQSIVKQDDLELTLANKFYSSCDSHCLYDYKTVLSDIENGKGGFIWKTDCWRWVTGYFCFTKAVAELEEIRDFAKGTCSYQDKN